MSYDFYIPCEPDEVIRATLTDDGELVLHDFDLETELAAEELGFDESLCLFAARLWQRDPVEFLCGSGVINYRHAALMACAWARGAVERESDELDAELLQICERALAQVERFFQSRPIHYGKLMNKRGHLVDLEYKRRQRFSPMGQAIGERSRRGPDHAVLAVIACIDTVSDATGQSCAFGGVPDIIGELCDVAKRVLKTSDEEQLVEDGIAALSELQRSQGGRR